MELTARGFWTIVHGMGWQSDQAVERREQRDGASDCRMPQAYPPRSAPDRGGGACGMWYFAREA
jgi:hypothetical protein